jgi:copper chaperone CopZ
LEIAVATQFGVVKRCIMSAAISTSPSILASRILNRALTGAKRTIAGSLTVLSASRKPLPLRRAISHAAPLRGAAVCCSADADTDLMELQLKIDGMVCSGCSDRVVDALKNLPQVKSVEVSLEQGIATVQLEAATQIDAFNSIPKLLECVTELGFEAQPHFG